MRGLLSEDPVPLGTFSDLRDWLPLLKEGSEPLESERILAVAEAIEQGAAVKRRLAEAQNARPCLLSDIPEITHLPGLASQIRRSIEPDGRLSDTASPQLQDIRRNLRSLRQEIRSRLEARMTEWSSALQEPLVLIRRDRYVVPVKPGFRRVVQGIILDQSASGQTLYIEPLLIQSANDRLAELRVAEIAEGYRILKGLTDEILHEREALEALVEWLIEFDVLLSMARFAEEYRCVEPEMGDSAALRLCRARHPLLERQKGRGEVVPLDLDLEGGKRQVIITGANTGGKTVALKTVGLLALMAHTGCPVPAAEGTKIPSLDQVFAEIGDDQSLAQNLSTFSARLAHQVNFMERATGRSLVLMDELGAGTDPAEGSALGVAVVETLASKGATVIVTTHHEALKTYADDAPAALNAAVEFDQERLAPTYRLISGIAGTSYALAVAERLGMPKEVVERAQQLMQGNDPESWARAKRLDEQARRLQALEKELNRDREDLEAERAEGLEEREKLIGQRDRFREKAEHFLREARLEVRKLEREARGAEHAAREALPAMKHRARRAAAALERAGKEVLAEAPPVERPRVEQRPVRPGDRVRSVSTGWKGVVTEGKNVRGEWCVSANGKRAWLSEEDLLILGPEEGGREEAEGAAKGIAFVHAGISNRDASPGIELYLLGQRVDEALSRVDKYLDEVALSGVPFVRIVHGKGTGALKRAVAESLEGHPLVRDFFPAEPEAGGDGVTVVELSGA